jgi:hypothetical protein
MPLNIKNGAKSTETKVEAKAAQKEEAEKVVAAASAAAPVYEDGVLGSKSGTVEFIAPLGDPSHPDTVKDEKTGEVSKTPYIVGYRFKALEDMVVPECGLADDAKKNLMSFKDKNGTKQVKAGEEFDLTRFETGLLFAPAEFNGRINGGGKSFTVVYQTNVVRSKTGKVGQASSATNIPTVALKADSGSLKEYKIIEVLSFTAETGANGTVRKKRTINPGFEKWEPLCIAQAPRVGTGRSGESTPKNVRNAKAEAFLAIVAKK